MNFFSECNAQYTKQQFYSSFHLGANFCQIDGDGASGFNKFGFSAGYLVGQGLGEAAHGGWSYLTGAGFSVRGSRRAFDPLNPGAQSFHLVYQMIDIPVYLVRYYEKWSLGGGLRTTYLLRAEDKDNFVLNLQSDMRQINVLGGLFLEYMFANNKRVVLESQYSLNSIRNSGSNLLFPTGVYHNVISFGLRLGVGNN